MSTIVVVKKNDVAAIAADSLTVWGSARESAEYVTNYEKIIKMGNSYVALAGPTAAKFFVREYVQGKNEVDLSGVAPIVRFWRELHLVLKDHYFLNPDEDRDDSFESSRFDALIANVNGIFGVSVHRAVQEFSKFFAYGSGREYALGAMWTSYDQPTLSAEAIARLAIEAAAQFDSDTGLPLTCYTVPLTKTASNSDAA